jgi:hypothetical protein
VVRGRLDAALHGIVDDERRGLAWVSLTVGSTPSQGSTIV